MSNKMISKRTHKYKSISIWTGIIQALILYGPLIYFLCDGFANGTIAQKFTMSTFAVVAVILSLLNILLKMHIRSTIWIILIGLSFCVTAIQPIIIVLGAASIIDEFILTPIRNNAKRKYEINKEIDLRND